MNAISTPPTAAELRAVRDFLGLPAPVFADLMGVSLRTLRRWEGDWQVPDGVRPLIDRLRQRARDEVDRLVETMTDKDHPAQVVGREDFWDGQNMPASWHRAVAARAMEQLPDIRLVFADEPRPIRQPKPVVTVDKEVVVEWDEAVGPKDVLDAVRSLVPQEGTDAALSHMVDAYTAEVSDRLPEGLTLTPQGLKTTPEWAGTPEVAKEALRAAVSAVDTPAMMSRIKASKPAPEAVEVSRGVWAVKAPARDLGAVFAHPDGGFDVVDAEHAWLPRGEAPVLEHVRSLHEAIRMLESL